MASRPLLPIPERLSANAGPALVATLGLSSLSALAFTGRLSPWFFLQLNAVAFFQFALAEIPGRPSRFERVTPELIRKQTSTLREVCLWMSCLLPSFTLLSPLLSFPVFALLLLTQRRGLLVWIQSILRKKSDSARNQQKYLEERYDIAVHIAGPADSAYQINQWLPVLEALDCKVCILTRKLELVAHIHETSLAIYYAKTHAQASWFLSHGPRVALYTASSSENSQALRESQLIHVMLNHGESDKVVSQSKFLMAFDRLFLAGPLAERRIRRAALPLRRDQAVLIGRPQAEMFLERRSESTSLRKILYAPTWEGTSENANYGSVERQGVELIRTLITRQKELGVELTVKPHPYTGIRRAATRKALHELLSLCEAAEVRVLRPHEPLYEAMNWSDLLITDVSSVLNDYLITQKPIVLCNTQSLPEAELIQAYPSSRAAALLTPGDDIAQLLDEVRREDRWATHREQLRRDSLGDFPVPALERFKQAIDELLQESRAQSAALEPDTSST